MSLNKSLHYPVTATIVPLKQSQIPEAARLMARAFEQDPVAAYMLPKGHEHFQAMQWFWRFALHQSLRYQQVYTTAPDLQGVASWLPPQSSQESLLTIFQFLVEGVFQWGWRSMSRLLALLELSQELRSQYCPHPHWYLDGLAVDPATQGQGIGGKLLTPILTQADQEETSCCLYTSTEGAIRFYQRYQFTVQEEFRCGQAAPPLWFMVRPPQTGG